MGSPCSSVVVSEPEPGDVPAGREMVTSVTPSTSSSRTRTRSAADGGQVLADVVGSDRQLAVSPVDQHGQPDDARSADVAEGIQGRTDRPARVEHVVDQHDDRVVDALRQVGAADGPGRDGDAGRRGTW